MNQPQLDHQNSQTEYARAKRLMPGGVNSAARAFGAVGGEPIVFERGEGAYLFDIDGNKYICLLYTSPSPRDRQKSRMPSSA